MELQVVLFWTFPDMSLLSNFIKGADCTVDLCLSRYRHNITIVYHLISLSSCRQLAYITSVFSLRMFVMSAVAYSTTNARKTAMICKTNLAQVGQPPHF